MTDLGKTAEILRCAQDDRLSDWIAGLEAFFASLRLGKTEAECCGGNRKDRDIGYAPAANSCEGVNYLDACTVAVLDAITAFAVSNPGVSSQIRRFFRV
jgi:hypothetical protein